jgi:hypothetical protein
MKQILHIFLKDARHFWGEIFLSLAITAAFVCVTPHRWPANFVAHGYLDLAGILVVLVPVSWWILTARVILAERLVGDTQFWITRPYVWSNLFMAKLLFLAAFIYLPFCIAQCVLLSEAGFAPQSYLPGLLYDQMMVAGIIVLPLAAIDAITSSFARMTLILLGIYLGFLAFAALSMLSASAHVDPIDNHLTFRLCFPLAVLVFSAAIVLQYALRRVWLARGVLISLPFLLWAAALFAAHYDQAQFNRIYPAVKAGAPIQITVLPNLRSTESTSFQGSPSEVTIPLSFSMDETGVAEGYAVLTDAVRADVTAPDGSKWSSDWQAAGGYKFLPGEVPFSPGFAMPIAVYNKFKSMPLTVQLTLAITQAQAVRVNTVALATRTFSAPEFGNCAPETGWGPEFGGRVLELSHITGISCVAALSEPQLTFVSTHWTNGPCPASAGAPDPGVLGTAWVGSIDREPAQFGISPVVDAAVNLSNRYPSNQTGLRYLCPGTPIVFTQYKPAHRMQITTNIEGYHLPQVSIEGNRITISQ